MSGKAYMNKKPIKERNCGDLYDTPMSLVWKLLEKMSFYNILEPAAGNGAIVKALKLNGNDTQCKSGDIASGQDFFQLDKWDGDILTNFPFTNWDNFIFHAKRITTGRVCVLGKGNFLGCAGRSRSGIWDGLKMIYFFNRYPDYRTPYREDGLFCVGGLCAGWFIWEPGYTGPHMFEILDINDYAKLGSYKEPEELKDLL